MTRTSAEAPDEARHAAELLDLGDAFFELDREWRVLRVNKRQEELFRKPSSDTVGRPFGEVWPELATPESRGWRECHRCMEERVAVRFEEFFAPPRGWIAVAAYPVSHGGMAVFLRDIGDQKAAEAEIGKRAAEESEERFRLLAEAMPQIVCVLQPDGTATYLNRTWVAFSGLDRAATNAAGWPGVLHPDDAPVARDCRIRVLKLQVPQEVELRYRSADGSFRWFLSRLAPVVEDGRVVRLVGAAMDIEDRKRAEAERKRIEVDLRRANEALREADRRKDEFLGMLSHELRNPLAPIRNSLYILDSTAADGQQARHAKEVANRQIAHMTRLVDDLLDVTRIARGKIELRRADFDLAALARRTAEDHRPVMQGRRVELEFLGLDQSVIVYGDETRLAQVLGNLLHNAAKFTPAGGRVTLSVGREDRKAVVRVRDTGAGISREILPMIFEPFTQAKQTLARSEGGLGLGLALVKGLVALHDGEVVASSRGPGSGTEFVVTLPTSTASTSEVRVRASRGEAPQARQRRVLVIDDNHDAADSLAELVTMSGHRADVAYDAFDGLQKVADGLPDVVLCDIGLPGMDGYEFARQLRARSSSHAVRLVAVSGYAQPDDVARAVEAGFDAHVAKPPDPEEITALLG